jgi:formiminotetrahydrofolate cyclodeaminase
MSFREETLTNFLEQLASSAPTPGGGTASAAAGAVAAALLKMVCALTFGKEKFRNVEAELRPVAEEAERAGDAFRELMDDDSEAFEEMAAARKLPRDNDEQKALRLRAMRESARRAAQVPMETARAAATLLSRAPLLAEKGNPNAASDVGVAALLLAAAAEGALLNVGINLSSTQDAEFIAAMERETAILTREVERLRDQTVALVRKSFKG